MVLGVTARFTARPGWATRRTFLGIRSREKNPTVLLPDAQAGVKLVEQVADPTVTSTETGWP